MGPSMLKVVVVGLLAIVLVVGSSSAGGGAVAQEGRERRSASYLSGQAHSSREGGVGQGLPLAPLHDVGLSEEVDGQESPALEAARAIERLLPLSSQVALSRGIQSALVQLEVIQTPFIRAGILVGPLTPFPSKVDLAHSQAVLDDAPPISRLVRLYSASSSTTVAAADKRRSDDSDDDSSDSIMLVEENNADEGGLETRGGKRRLLAAATRRDLYTQTELSNRFCAMTEEGTCNWQGYAVYLGTLLAVRVLMAVLTLLAIPIYLILRCCCGCCGGRRPNNGLCWGKPIRGYTKEQLLYFRGAVLVVTGACVILIIVGYASNAKVSKGINGLLNAFTELANDVIGGAKRVADALAGLEYTQDAAGGINEAVANAEDMNAIVEDYKTQVSFYDKKYRVLIINLSLVVPCAIFFLGVVLGHVNIRCFLIPLAMLTLLTLFVLWLSVGVHDVLATVILDACSEFEIIQEEQASNTDNGTSTDVLSVLFACSKGGDGPFQPFKAVIEDALALINTGMCSGSAPICNLTTLNITCPEIPSSLPTSTLSLPPCYPYSPINCTLPCTGRDSVAESYVEDPRGSQNWISFLDCPEQCQDEYYVNQTTPLVESFNLASQYMTVLEEDVLPLLNCDFIADFVENVQTSLCEDLAIGLRSIKRSQQGLCIILMFGSILLIVGVKRFAPMGEAVKLEDQERMSSSYSSYSDDDGPPGKAPYRPGAAMMMGGGGAGFGGAVGANYVLPKVAYNQVAPLNTGIDLSADPLKASASLAWATGGQMTSD